MALVLRFLGGWTKKYLFEDIDERVKDFPFMNNAAWIYVIVGGYLVFVKWLGPRIMKDRAPFELKTCMIVYNLIQVIANFCLGIYSIKHSYARSDWSLWCQPYRPNDGTMQSRIESTCAYLYFALKVSDLLDTIFFVLRKKGNQVTFLHLYHHSMMAFTSYYSIRNMLMGHVALMPIMNMFVHAIMYGYYFMTCIRPTLKKSVWWKKHITQVQLLQFFILFIHFGRPLVMQDCSYYTFVLVMCFLQNLFMIVMFSDFYRRTYLTPKGKKHTS